MQLVKRQPGQRESESFEEKTGMLQNCVCPRAAFQKWNTLDMNTAEPGETHSSLSAFPNISAHQLTTRGAERPRVTLRATKTPPRRAVRFGPTRLQERGTTCPGRERSGTAASPQHGRAGAEQGQAPAPRRGLRPGPRRRPSPVGAEQRLVDQHDEEGARPVEEG